MVSNTVPIAGLSSNQNPHTALESVSGVTEGDRIGLVQELRTMHAEELVQILQGVIERVQAKKPSKKQALAWLSRQGDLTPAK